MTYNVFGGTLSLAQSINFLTSFCTESRNDQTNVIHSAEPVQSRELTVGAVIFACF